MKILHVSNSDSGGAGIAALRLHNALLSLGVDSKMLVLHKKQNNKEVYQINRSFKSKIISYLNIPYKQNKYQSYLNKYGSRYEAISFPEAIFDISKLSIVQEADIINLHWVGSMLNYKQFFNNVHQPIVWTLHDMNPFLGCAHYMGDKKKNSDLSYMEERIRELKIKAINQHPSVVFVTLCQWMQQHIHQSAFSSHSSYVIPNSVNCEVFKNYPQLDIRKVLGLSSDKPIFMFASQHISNFRKGGDILLETLKRGGFDCEFIVVGADPKNIFDDLSNIKYFGSVHDELLLAFLYAASDAFILPSREDNLPNTLVESLCCGTPVISMPNGGMRNHITDFFNGLIAKSVSVEALYDAIQIFIKEKKRFNREDILSDAHNKYTPQIQAAKYVHLYEQLLKK